MKPALYLALLPLIIFSPARAQEYEHGTALLCDTQRQAERYVELFNGKEQSAINAVNAEEQNPTACVFETVAFMRGPGARDREEQGKGVPDRSHSCRRRRDTVGVAFHTAERLLLRIQSS